MPAWRCATTPLSQHLYNTFYTYIIFSWYANMPMHGIFSTSTLLYHLLYHCKLYVEGDMPMCRLEPYSYVNRQYVMHLGTNADKDLSILICQYADVAHTVLVICRQTIFQVAHNDTRTILYLFLLQEITLFPPKMANGRRIG